MASDDYSGVGCSPAGSRGGAMGGLAGASPEQCSGGLNSTRLGATGCGGHDELTRDVAEV